MTKKSYHHGDLKNALIQAGIDILAHEGLGALSLRKVARHAGVSHTAPYAHFADKQALIAAISTNGHEKIYDKIAGIAERYPDDPLRQLVETAWAYAQFGFEAPDHFRITFSGVVEKERDYPALVEMASKNMEVVRALVSRCQAAGILAAGEPDLVAVGVWGLVHGFVSLVQQGQVSRSVLDRYSLREMLIVTLGQISRAAIDPQAFPVKLLVATNNPGKVREYEELLTGLPFRVTYPAQEGIDLEVEESGATFEENARLKALAFARASGLLTLADDSGLEVDALGGAPGVYSARYAGPGAGDADRYRKLLGELAAVPEGRRAARFRCVIALAWPDGTVRTVEGTCEGQIGFVPRGEHGFGYDPVFIVDGRGGQTMAELPPEVKNRISHRARAVEALRRGWR